MSIRACKYQCVHKPTRLNATPNPPASASFPALLLPSRFHPSKWNVCIKRVDLNAHSPLAHSFFRSFVRSFFLYIFGNTITFYRVLEIVELLWRNFQHSFPRRFIYIFFAFFYLFPFRMAYSFFTRCCFGVQVRACGCVSLYFQSTSILCVFLSRSHSPVRLVRQFLCHCVGVCGSI